jgi:pilus assembly protein CpaC
MNDTNTSDRATRLRRIARAGMILTASFSLTFAAMHVARANNDVVTLAPNTNMSITVAQGKPRTVRTSLSVHEIVIGNPEIADIGPLTDRSFYVLGTQLGTTGVALFDENKQLIGSLDIEVSLDTDRLADTIRRSVPGSDIRVQSANGRVLLSGSASDAVAAERARSIASRYSGGEEVIDSVNITSSQQVQLNVRIVEINRRVGQELGARIGVEYVGTGGSISFNSTPATGTRSPAGELIGNIVSGGLSVDVAIKALEDRGMARRLAEPNLIARSGQRASFLAGGEFPIPVPGEGGSVTIEYKRFGVGLDFTPTVLEDGLVSLEIQPEVSSIDASASYSIGNISVPGFSVRRASTSIDLKSGQSFMIAGLLQSENSTVTQRVPGLGNIPVLGALFSSKAYQRRETDLVIIVTPHLVRPIDPTKRLTTPHDGSLAPSSADYFLGNRDEINTRAALHGYAAAAVPVAAGGGHILDLPMGEAR